MRYYVKTVVGLGVLVAGITAFVYGLVDILTHIHGSCGSGGPYVSAAPCPSNTGAWIVIIVLSAFVAVVGGLFYATRGAPPGGRSRTSGDGLGSLSESASSIGGLGAPSGAIMGAATPASGSPAPTPSFGSLQTPSFISSPPSAAPAGGSGGMDTQIARLEKLDQLHRRGALTDAEFEREKARVIGNG